jgi:hypothetical protein
MYAATEGLLGFLPLIFGGIIALSTIFLAIGTWQLVSIFRRAADDLVRIEERLTDVASSLRSIETFDGESLPPRRKVSSSSQYKP